MYKTFEEAKADALKVIEKNYGGQKFGCCISESKIHKNSRKTTFNFRFHSQDTNGEFIQNSDGSYTRLYAI